MAILTDTEVIEQLCGVTVHGLDRINERFNGKIENLVDVVVKHIGVIRARNLTGPSTYTLNGISTVIELIDDVPTLVTAYPYVKDNPYAPVGGYKGKWDKSKHHRFK